MSDAVEGHVCLLPFDTDDPEFVRGFEAGRVWQLLHEDPAVDVEEIVHGVNAEMLLRMSEATGRAVRSEELDGAWITVHFAAAEAREV